LNWIEQLVKSRKLNFGLWGTWGDVRRTGFAYNWSRTGATTTAVILNGQHSGLASQVADGEVNIVIIFIGANGFYHTQLSDAPFGSIQLGTQSISLYIPGDEPHHAFLSDTVHPGTVLNGLFADYLVNKMNQDFGTAITPLTTSEILNNAGMQ
jgi:hypothetical protein